MVLRGLIQRPVARKNAHYPILILFSYVLCCILESKKEWLEKKFEYFFIGSEHP